MIPAPIAPYAKAVVSLVVCAAAYLVGILTGDQSLGDLTTVQWLGLVVFLGASFGVTYGVPNRAVGKRKAE